MNKARTRSFARAVANGCNVAAAARMCGVSKSAFYEWMAKGRADRDAGLDTEHSRFLDLSDEALAAREAALTKNIAAASKHPQQWTAAAWLLERSDPKRWGKREPIDARPKDDGTDQESAFDWTRLTAAQQRTMRELLALATTTAAPTVTVEPAAPADPEPASTETKP